MQLHIFMLVANVLNVLTLHCHLNHAIFNRLCVHFNIFLAIKMLNTQ